MSISTVTIVGAGYMGGGIAQVLAIAGFDVTIADVDVAVADKSLERLQQEARDFEEQGLFAPGSAELVAKNISAGKSIEDAVADVDFIEERSEEHTSELQSRGQLVCRLLLEKKK